MKALSIIAAATLCTIAYGQTPADSAAQPDTGGIVVVKETRDTVYVIDKPHVEQALCGWRGKMSELRAKGWGGSGGPAFGVMAVYTGPLRDFITYDSKLSGYSFQINPWFEPVIMNGGLGYGGVGNGVRLGGVGMSGHRTFVSNVYNDSIVSLKTEIHFGGFLIEKAFVDDRMNYLGGGYIGAGNIDITRSIFQQNERTFFTDVDIDAEKGATASAHFACVELHGGFTYTFWTFVHAGANVSLPVFISSDGFGGQAGDFVSINPQLQVRIMFGTLG
jgi:hypothetical protein